MANGIVDIDHVMCQVPDTGQAAAAFDRLGFITTPHSSISGSGVANRLVILRPKGDGVANFIELMAIEDPASLEPRMADVLAGPPGIKSLVHALSSADSARESLIASGFAMLDVWPKKRTWLLPSGEELQIAFRVLLPEPGQVPLMVNGVEYLTLHHYLRPEFQQHPNGALRLVRVTAVLDEDGFDESVAVYERFYGAAADWASDGATIEVRDTILQLLTRDGLGAAYGEVDLSSFAAPCYGAVTIEVADIARAGELLAANDVRHVRRPDSVVIEPAAACGMILEFREP